MCCVVISRPDGPIVTCSVTENDLTHERWTPYQAFSSPRTVAGLRSKSMSAVAAGCKTLPCN